MIMNQNYADMLVCWCFWRTRMETNVNMGNLKNASQVEYLYQCMPKKVSNDCQPISTVQQSVSQNYHFWVGRLVSHLFFTEERFWWGSVQYWSFKPSRNGSKGSGTSKVYSTVSKKKEMFIARHLNRTESIYVSKAYFRTQTKWNGKY